MKMRRMALCALFLMSVLFGLFSQDAHAQTANDMLLARAVSSSARYVGATDTLLQEPQTDPGVVLPSSQTKSPFARANRASQPPLRPNGADDRVSVLSPHMIDRARQILVLRRLLAFRFSAEDLTVALPLLRRLNDIKTAPSLDPEQALEAEYQALLAMSPGDPLPPSSALKIVDAARFYSEEQTRIWSEMERKLGKTKSGGLRDLLGQQDTPRNAVGLPQAVVNSAGQANSSPPLSLPSRANTYKKPSWEDSVVVYSPTTVRISLLELIDLIQTKLKVMTRRP